MPSISTTIFQKNLKVGLNPLLQAKLASEKTQFMVFPEYFFVGSAIKDYSDIEEAGKDALSWLQELSSSYKGIVIGGSVIRRENDKLYNSTPIIYNGQIIDYANKRNLIEKEKDFLTPGKEAGIFVLNNMRFAVLVCADLFVEEYFQELADEGVKLVFIPVTSKFKSDDFIEEKQKRDEKYFLERSRKYDMTIIKCGSVGEIFGNPVQGRSFVSTKNGITWRVGVEEENKEIVKRATVIYSSSQVKV